MMTDTNESVITVKLRRTNFYTRYECLFCGGCSQKEAVNAEVWSSVVNVRENQTEAAWTGLVVCSQCLKRDVEQLAATVRESAAWHRERAAELESIAADLPPLPTVAEWETANQQVDDEFLVDAM